MTLVGMSEPSEACRVVLDLEPHPDTIRGWIGYPDDVAVRFYGWLEMSSHLDRLRPLPHQDDSAV